MSVFLKSSDAGKANKIQTHLVKRFLDNTLWFIIIREVEVLLSLLVLVLNTVPQTSTQWSCGTTEEVLPAWTPAAVSRSASN